MLFLLLPPPTSKSREMAVLTLQAVSDVLDSLPPNVNVTPEGLTTDFPRRPETFDLLILTDIYNNIGNIVNMCHRVLEDNGQKPEREILHQTHCIAKYTRRFLGTDITNAYILLALMLRRVTVEFKEDSLSVEVVLYPNVLKTKPTKRAKENRKYESPSSDHSISFPTEIVAEIFKYLPKQHLEAPRRSCKMWLDVAYREMTQRYSFCPVHVGQSFVLYRKSFAFAQMELSNLLHRTFRRDLRSHNLRRLLERNLLRFRIHSMDDEIHFLKSVGKFRLAVVEIQRVSGDDSYGGPRFEMGGVTYPMNARMSQHLRVYPQTQALFPCRIEFSTVGTCYLTLQRPQSQKFFFWRLKLFHKGLKIDASKEFGQLSDPYFLTPRPVSLTESQ